MLVREGGSAFKWAVVGTMSEQARITHAKHARIPCTRAWQDVVPRLVEDSVGDRYYAKAAACVAQLRDAAIRHGRPGVYNNLVMQVRGAGAASGGSAWSLVGWVFGGWGLISHLQPTLQPLSTTDRRPNRRPNAPPPAAGAV